MGTGGADGCVTFLDPDNAEANFQLAQSLLVQMSTDDIGQTAAAVQALAAAGYRAAELLCQRCQHQAQQPKQECSCLGASPVERAASLLDSMDQAAQPALKQLQQDLLALWAHFMALSPGEAAIAVDAAGAGAVTALASHEEI